MSEDVLKALSYAHSTEVLSCLRGGSKRFSQIERELSLNSNVVNMRLKDLRAAGLVEKVERGVYRLTEDGEHAAEILENYEEL